MDDQKNMGIKSNIKEKMEVYVAQNNLRKNSNQIYYSFLCKTQWLKNPGQTHFSRLIFPDCSLKSSKQKVSYFEPFQSYPKGI